MFRMLMAREFRCVVPHRSWRHLREMSSDFHYRVWWYSPFTYN